jgi:hypothetical protein
MAPKNPNFTGNGKLEKLSRFPVYTLEEASCRLCTMAQPIIQCRQQPTPKPLIEMVTRAAIAFPNLLIA